MRVLGVDPSLANWGMVLADYSPPTDTSTAKITLIAAITQATSGSRNLRAKKKIKPMFSENQPKYLDYYFRSKLLNQTFKEWSDLADIIVAEIPFGSQNHSAALSQGICTGILATSDKPLITVSPFDVKFVLGERTISKSEIHKWVCQNHPGVIDKTMIRGSHQADAVIAIYAAFDKLKEFYNANYLSGK